MKMKSFSNPYFHAIIFKLSFPCMDKKEEKNTKPSSRMDARAESPSKRKKKYQDKKKKTTKRKKNTKPSSRMDARAESPSSNSTFLAPDIQKKKIRNTIHILQPRTKRDTYCKDSGSVGHYRRDVLAR